MSGSVCLVKLAHLWSFKDIEKLTENWVFYKNTNSFNLFLQKNFLLILLTLHFPNKYGNMPTFGIFKEIYLKSAALNFKSVNKLLSKGITHSIIGQVFAKPAKPLVSIISLICTMG